MSAAEDEAVPIVPALFLIDPGAAASGAIRTAIEAVLRQGQQFIVRDDAVGSDTVSTEDLLALPDGQRDVISLVMGPFPFGVDRRWRRPVRYAAVLREPMARIASLHASRSQLAGEHGRRSVSLGAFVFDERHLAADNGQTRLIAGRRQVRFGECSESLYEEAVANIEERFETVLLAEEPRRSLDILGRLLDLDLVGPGFSDEHPPGREADIVDATSGPELERVLELNGFDLRLHAFARHRFDTAAAGKAE